MELVAYKGDDCIARDRYFWYSKREAVKQFKEEHQLKYKRDITILVDGKVIR